MAKILKNRKKSLSVLLIAVMAFTMMSSIPVSAGITTNVTGKSTVSQTVYSGPSTSYVSVGSISAGEVVYILDKELELPWYHIIYNVGSYGAQKSGYVPTNSLTSISGSVYEHIFSGGEGYSNEDQSVYSTEALEMVTGSISASEPVTVLETTTYWTGSNYFYVAFIEYSTSSGPKRGYTGGPQSTGGTGITQVTKSSVARVKSNANLYYGTSTSLYEVAGTVYANEYVTVIAKNDDWVYVEYNTNSGRKRGYFSTGYLRYHKILDDYPNLYTYYTVPGEGSIPETKAVYAGPNSSYPIIGTLYKDDTAKYYSFGEYKYVEYYTSSGLRKSGFIK